MSYESLIAGARRIKTETLDRANTAMRVGGWMEEALRYLRDLAAGKCDATSQELVTQAKGIVAAINEVAGYAGMSEERYEGILSAVTGLSASLTAETAERQAADALLAQQVKEYQTKGQFPASGHADRLYIAADTGKEYRWDGSSYVALGGYTGGYGITITPDGEISTSPLRNEDIMNICR